MLLKGEAINKYTFFLEVPHKEIKKRSTTIKIAVYKGKEKIQTVSTKFLAPFM
jgi:hypothetical protein